MVVDTLYGENKPRNKAELPFDLQKAFEQALKDVYTHHNTPSDFVPEGLFNGILDTLNCAIPEGLNNQYPDLASIIKSNNEVFAAFKVHDECSRMAKLLIDENGEVKSFEQWRKDAEPIGKHHNQTWLRTEYDTAIKRANQALQWQQFEEEADVLPNLRWVPSTAVTPGPDHSIFWETILPIGHPFWSSHRPGDRWGCQCSLEATDEPATSVPHAGGKQDEPAPGLDSNPGKTGELFSKSHPYFPQNCASCPFNGESSTAMQNKAGDCTRCRFMQSCIHTKKNGPEYTIIKRKNGKEIRVSELIDTSDTDYNKLMQIAEAFAEMGNNVTLTPKMTRPPKFDYDCFYQSLRGTKYENKCPDLLINGKWYEHEGYCSTIPKNALRNMFNHGLSQSNRLIFDEVPGMQDWYIKKRVWSRIQKGQDIAELWIRSSDGIRLIFKKHEER